MDSFMLGEALVECEALAPDTIVLGTTKYFTEPFGLKDLWDAKLGLIGSLFNMVDVDAKVDSFSQRLGDPTT